MAALSISKHYLCVSNIHPSGLYFYWNHIYNFYQKKTLGFKRTATRIFNCCDIYHLFSGKCLSEWQVFSVCFTAHPGLLLRSFFRSYKQVHMVAQKNIFVYIIQHKAITCSEIQDVSSILTGRCNIFPIWNFDHIILCRIGFFTITVFCGKNIFIKYVTLI